MYALNQPALDYLTLTTWNPIAMGHVQTWIENREGSKVTLDAKRMQYTGALYATRDGSFFLGEAEQRGQPHFLMQCSGFLADDLLTVAGGMIVGGYVRVTRIDLQLTVEYDRGSWSQAALADAMRQNSDRSVSYVESKSGPQGSKLATVYFGSRKSDRFFRIYEKMGMGEDVHLRLEVEYKAPRALGVALALLNDPTIGEILADEVDRLPDVRGVRGLFLSPLGNPTAYPVKIVKQQPNTVKWLIEQVAPALDRVLNDHNIPTDDVVQLFYRILQPHLGGSDVRGM